MSCDLWPLSSTCLPEGWSTDPATWDDAQAEAVEAASEILRRLSGGVYGLCTLKIRPCRRRCAELYGADRVLRDGLGVSGGPWTPALIDGRMYNITCGCVGECGCSPLCEIILNPPAFDVLAVKIDGQTLPSTAYRVDQQRRLVRVDGQCWPDCQEIALEDTQPNTWSVLYRTGRPVPAGGRVAMTELATNLWQACNGMKCKLPARVTQVVRDGVTYDLIDDLSVFERGRTGLNRVDMWLASVNPYAARAPMAVWSPDLVTHRRTTFPDLGQVSPPDPGHDGATSFTYTQLAPSTLWIITHDLGFRPAGVQVHDNAGQEIVGQVEYPSLNVVTIEFSAPVSGVAYLS